MQQNSTVAGLGSAPDPAGGAYSAPPDLLAGFKGAASRRGGEGEAREGEGEGKEKGGEGQGVRGRGWEVDCDAQLEQGRRLAKVGPGDTRRFHYLRSIISHDNSLFRRY